MINIRARYVAELGFELPTSGSAVRRPTDCEIEPCMWYIHTSMFSYKIRPSAQQFLQLTCTLSEDSDQLVHLRNLIRGFAIRSVDGYPAGTQCWNTVDSTFIEHQDVESTSNRRYAVCPLGKDPKDIHAVSEDSDQTARMRRLIWVFAGRPCKIVGIVEPRLK